MIEMLVFRVTVLLYWRWPMKRVLLVDDAQFIRNSLRIILEKNGYEIIGQADDGVQGVILYKALKPDIVTMDITMPNKDGLQALKEIKAMDKAAKVVMITAMGREDIVREAIINGASNFIVKPFNEDKVLAVMEKL
jgi:two-component system chemotaxis response regulator CheY